MEQTQTVKAQTFRSRSTALDRITKHGWTLADEPGVFMEIPKHQLKIDDSYQRGEVKGKIMELARDWSWMACGAIIVAERDTTDFFVIEGQQRVAAAMKRDDIKDMPCMVWSVTDIRSEALAFLRTNTNRKPVTAFDKFKASVLINDPTTKAVQALVTSVGREVANRDSPTTVRCVGTLIEWVNKDKKTITTVWPVIAEICEGAFIHNRIVQGACYLEAHLDKGVSLTDSRYRKILKELGPDPLLKAIAKASSYYTAGGAKVWAMGILDAINFNRKIKLTIRVSE